MTVFGCTTSSDNPRHHPHSLATMNPSSGHSTNAYSQPSQFRPLYTPTTSQSQLDSLEIPLGNPNLVNLTSTRPLGDASRTFKTGLRVAEDAEIQHAYTFPQRHNMGMVSYLHPPPTFYLSQNYNGVYIKYI